MVKIRGKARNVLITLLTCALLVCVVQAVSGFAQEAEEETIYDQANNAFVEIVGQHEDEVMEADTPAPAVVSKEEETESPEADEPTEPEEPQPTQPVTKPTEPAAKPVKAAEMKVSFDKLQAVNPDVVGWIAIDDTSISYPVVQGTDNEQYLNTAYNNQKSKAGSIYVDYRVNGDFTGRNTILYGHNLRSRSMFGTLPRYSSQSYYEQHRYFHIIRPEGLYQYEIFSAYKADIDGDAFIGEFHSEEGYARFLESITQQSEIDTGVTPETGDLVVTLSTCTSDPEEREAKRYVVHGRLATFTPAAAPAS